MYQTLLYYNYVPVPNAKDFSVEHLQYCKDIDLVGRIIIADEGINGTVSGRTENCKKYISNLTSIRHFSETKFKCEQVSKPSFVKMHVKYKREIVNSGLLEKNIEPTKKTGVHISPAEFDSMKEKEDVAILDIRSNYEHNVGRFKNAVTLDIDNFREFPDKIDELAGLKDKIILTYCTGGIKCEKASAFLLSNGFKKVYQLDGGIINHAKEMNGKDFEGKCYVFDNRVVVDINKVNPKTIGECICCKKKYSKMINCANPKCNKHFIQCEQCGWVMDGCCSDECMNSKKKREYDGSGYYLKNTQNLKSI